MKSDANLLGSSHTGVDVGLVFGEESGETKICYLRPPFFIQ